MNMFYCWGKALRTRKIIHFRSIQNTSATRLCSTTVQTLPRKADVVVCGGGVVGSSVAYHLAARGIKNILLLEQGRLACGTTWHAAGLIGRFKHGLIFQLASYSHQLYKWMDENGYPTGFKQCGRLDIATSPAMLADFRRLADENRIRGLIVEELTPSEVQKKSPWVETKDIQGGFWVPADATTSPTDVCVSLAKMAKDKGAQVFESCRVENVCTKDGAVNAVETSLGVIECKKFILCGGVWSRHFAANVKPSIRLPVQATQHFYLVTKPISGVDILHPVLRDKDACMYAREWSGGFLVGVFEPKALPIFDHGPPAKFEFQLLPENWEHFAPYFEPIIRRLPFLEKAEIRQMTNGPESFTPDCNPLIGEVPEVRGFYVATGMNSSGIMLAAGMGRIIAELIVDGKASVNISSFDVKRFLPHYSNGMFLRDRGAEAVGYHYKLLYPKQSYFTSGRDLWLSPLHSLHKEAGALFGTVNGYEIPLCFIQDKSVLADKTFSGTFSKPSWFDAVRHEQDAAKKQTVFCDLTGCFGAYDFFADDVKNIDELFSASIDIEVGKMVETQMLNHFGSTVTHCVVLKKSDRRYTMIYPMASQSYLKHWLKSMLKDENFADTTSSFTFIAFVGDTIRQFVTKMEAKLPQKDSYTESDFGCASNVLLFDCPWLPKGNLTCCIPTQHAQATYKVLTEESSAIGLHTVDLLRIEQGLPWWNHEITVTTKPKIPKQMRSFIGKSALSDEAQQTTVIHFSISNCDSDAAMWPWGGEMVLHKSKPVGTVTSVAYSYDRKQFVGMAVLDRDHDVTQDAKYDVQLAGENFTLDVLSIM